MIERVRREIENLLYPSLRAYGRKDRDRLLQKAAETPLDSIEWAGILAALVFAVTVTRYAVVDLGPMNRIAVAIVNFLVAILLLAFTAGPFLVRRTRRGLHSQLH